jgi:hypothetical protein
MPFEHANPPRFAQTSGENGMAKAVRRARKTARASARGNDLRRQILGRAVVDPEFRRRLFSRPEEVFAGRLSARDRAALERMKLTLPALDDIVTSLAGEVLCGGGGGCGGLA